MSEQAAGTLRRTAFAFVSTLALAAAIAGAAQAQPATDQPVATGQPASPVSADAQPSLSNGPSQAPAPQPGPVGAASGTTVSEVVVTGTQIRGVAPVGSPVIAVDQKAIQQTGLTTTSDVIHSIPQVSGIGPGESVTGTNANNATLNITGSNAIDLRGLGVQATLVLLDGRRVPPGGVGGQLFDPSNIPSIALQRIEVVADGASAIYGSDAVAGVANLILRKNFTGVEVEARYGGASDYWEKQFSAIGGEKWGSGSFMLAAEYVQHSHLIESDRASLFSCNQVQYGGTNNCSYDAAPGNVIDPGSGVRYGLPAGSGTGVTFAQLSTTPNYQQSYVDTDSIPALERTTIVGSLSQQVVDGVRFWAEGYYSGRRFSQLNPASTIDSSTPVPSTNPYFIAFPDAPGATSEVVQYSLENDLGANVRAGYERSYQGAAGIDIDLPRNFHLTLYGQNSGDDAVDDSEGVTNTAAVQAALDGTTAATAFDPYGSGGGATNVALANGFRAYDKLNSSFRQDLVNAKIDGSLFHLPGGDVKLAIGGEWREESLYDGELTNTGTPSLKYAQQVTATTNKRTVGSGFGEVFIPVVSDVNSIPFVQRLDFDVAGRYDNYSDVGSTANPKIGGRWDPVRDVTIHGSFGTSFRAPTLSDLNPDSTATVITIPNFGPGGNVLIVLGGNPNLKPETATTWSIGGDYNPSWLHGFRASINYYNIDYKNIIDTPGAFNIAAFLPSTAALYNPFVIRNPTCAQVDAVEALPFAPPPLLACNQINNILDGTRHNVGEALTDGFDLSANYTWTTGFGTWIVGGNATYVLNYNYQLVPGAPIVQRVNEVGGNAAAYPLRFKARGQVSWALGGFNANVFVNYSNGYENTAPSTGAIASEPIDSYTTVDGTLIYNTGDNPWFGGVYGRNLILSLNVINMFDQRPPLALISTSQEFDSTEASPIGRMISFDIRKRF